MSISTIDARTGVVTVTILASAVLAYLPPAGFSEFCALAKVLVPAFLAARLVEDAPKAIAAFRSAAGARTAGLRTETEES